MATTKQKEAARRNLEKARSASQRAGRTEPIFPGSLPVSVQPSKTACPALTFAFPKQRKEPLVDASHVRNAVARFDQVEDVSDADRDEAWRRIKSAARKYDVEVSADDWRELAHGGKLN